MRFKLAGTPQMWTLLSFTGRLTIGRHSASQISKEVSVRMGERRTADASELGGLPTVRLNLNSPGP